MSLIAALPPTSLSSLSVSSFLQLPLSIFWTQTGTYNPPVLCPVVYILGVFTSPTRRNPSSLLASFSGIPAASRQSTMDQKYQSQNSRKKHVLSFESWTILNSMKKSQGILLCLSRAVNHPFSQKVRLVYITRPMVTQLPCVLPEYLPWYCCACPLSNP